MRSVSASLLTLAAATVAAVLVLQLLRTGGLPDPTAHGDFGARVLDIAVLVFREGLESIIVLAAVTANMVGARRGYQRPVAAGALVALLATLVTWRFAVTIIDSLAENIPALDIQAATGLLAIIVLLVVMNWFFHKVYWSGLDLDAQPHEAVADSQRLRVESVVGPRAARVLVALSRRVRGRAVPAKLSVEARKRTRDVWRRHRLLADVPRGHPDLRRAPATSLSPHAGASPACCSASCCS